MVSSRAGWPVARSLGQVEVEVDGVQLRHLPAGHVTPDAPRYGATVVSIYADPLDQPVRKGPSTVRVRRDLNVPRGRPGELPLQQSGKRGTADHCPSDQGDAEGDDHAHQGGPTRRPADAPDREPPDRPERAQWSPHRGQTATGPAPGRATRAAARPAGRTRSAELLSGYARCV